MKALEREWPYFTARRLFIAGEITAHDAARLSSTDPEFLSDCCDNFLDPHWKAISLTKYVWRHR
jgi:hypothetical protein